MQTLDFVSGLHNCLEFSQPRRVYIRLCKHGKRFLLLKYVHPKRCTVKRPNFLRSTSLQILANKSRCVQTNLLFFLNTPHLRRKSTMRRCFYHTDLVQNAVFHNFSRQIAFIQYHAWTFNQRNRSKNFQNHLYGQPVLTFDERQICEEILKELRFNVIKNLLSLFFIHGFITMCHFKKHLIRSAF